VPPSGGVLLGAFLGAHGGEIAASGPDFGQAFMTPKANPPVFETGGFVSSSSLSAKCQIGLRDHQISA
jgi:hypothetical protein